MLPLTRERAVELHHEGVTVYGLTGAVSGQEQSQRVMNLELDILRHDGLFGVTKFEWENYKKSQESVMTPEEKSKLRKRFFWKVMGTATVFIRSTVDRKKEGISF